MKKKITALILVAVMVMSLAATAAAGYTPAGGSTGITTYDSFTDLADYSDDKDAVNWYLSSGVTNGGETWTTFGPETTVKRHEAAHVLYRFYTIMSADGMFFDDAGMGGANGKRYADATSSLRGAGIMLGDGSNCYGEDEITLQEFLTLFYRAINSDISCIVDGFSVAAGTYEDIVGYADAGDVSGYAVEAVAGMIRAGLYIPEGDAINPRDTVSLIEMVRLLYALRDTNEQITMAEKYESVIVTEDEQYTFTEDATLTDVNISVSETNASAVYVKDGAKVTIDGGAISSSALLEDDYPLAYRWARGAAVISNGAGTVLNYNNITQDITLDSYAGGLVATCGGTINVDNGAFTSSGLHNMGVTYGGVINVTNSVFSGSGRYFTSDFFGGVANMTNCVADIDSADTMGSCAFYVDEMTTVTFTDCELTTVARFGILTGVGRLVVNNTTIECTSFLEGVNATSMLTDIGTATVANSKITVNGGPLFNVIRAERMIISFKDTEIILNDVENMIELQSGGSARLYLDNTSLSGTVSIEPDCTLEVIRSNGATFDCEVVGGGTVSISLAD